MRGLRLACATAALACAGAVPALAAEQTLQFKLVVQQLSAPSDMPSIGGHQLMVGRYMGVAYFPDGRIAYKSFVDAGDDTANEGTFKGYSTYTFTNGDALTLSYTGTWDGNGSRGDYQVISGTGSFTGATGTGSFEGLDEPWDEANLLDVTIKVTVPSQ